MAWDRRPGGQPVMLHHGAAHQARSAHHKSPGPAAQPLEQRVECTLAGHSGQGMARSRPCGHASRPQQTWAECRVSALRGQCAAYRSPVRVGERLRRRSRRPPGDPPEPSWGHHLQREHTEPHPTARLPAGETGPGRGAQTDQEAPSVPDPGCPPASVPWRHRDGGSQRPGQPPGGRGSWPPASGCRPASRGVPTAERGGHSGPS